MFAPAAPATASPAEETPDADRWRPPGVNAPPADNADPPGAGVYVLRVHFDVMRVDIPVDETRQSSKIWNHVDESRGDPGLTALLARNGFRVGIGGAADWPAIRTVLELNEARVTRVARTAQEGAPLTVPLGSIEEGTSYFLHRRGGGLGGGTFPAGQRLVRVEYALDSADPLRVWLHATPVFEEQRTRQKAVERDGEIVMVRDHEGRVFRELTAEAAVGPGDYLVVGSSAPADSGVVLGSCWLDSMLGIQKYETVLFISARATRIE